MQKARWTGTGVALVLAVLMVRCGSSSSSPAPATTTASTATSTAGATAPSAAVTAILTNSCGSSSCHGAGGAYVSLYDIAHPATSKATAVTDINTTSGIHQMPPSTSSLVLNASDKATLLAYLNQ